MEYPQELNKYFSDIKYIGKGAFGIVYRAIWKINNQIVAIKQLDTSKLNNNNLESLNLEIEILIRLSRSECNRNVICYYDNLSIGNNQYIIMEYIDGITIQNIKNDIENIRDTENKYLNVLIMLKQIINGINYIHGKGIVHSDIKPDNILIRKDDLSLVIVDFGLSCILEDHGCPQTKGNLKTISPETIIYKKRNFYNDVWSIGITILDLLKIDPHPNLKNIKDIKQNINIIENDIIFEDPYKTIPNNNKYYGKILSWLIDLMLEKDYCIRYDSERLFDILRFLIPDEIDPKSSLYEDILLKLDFNEEKEEQDIENGISRNYRSMSSSSN